METSAVRVLTLLCLIIAVSHCYSMQHTVESVRRSLRSLREPRTQDGARMEGIAYSRKAGSSSTTAPMNTGVHNMTVPHFLRELYLHLEEPASHMYSDVNSILSYENQAINGSESLLHSLALQQCWVLRLGARYSSGQRVCNKFGASWKGVD